MVQDIREALFLQKVKIIEEISCLVVVCVAPGPRMPVKVVGIET